MLKFTSLAIGLLTAISIVPSAQALPLSGTPIIVTQTYRGDRTPVVVVTPQTYSHSRSGYSRGWEASRRRQLEIIRAREARARWEARSARYKQYNNYHSNDRYTDYRRDNNSYGDRREYRY